jgi:peptidoglycan/LPS O-acetylase OafA/YrhL
MMAEQMAQTQGSQYIPILDGWRAVAILLVILFHGLYNTDTTASRLLTALANLAGRAGPLGVLIFFTISGYLITKKLLWESQDQGSFSVRAFYIKRAFRILPALAAYLIVLVVLNAAGVIRLSPGDWSAPLFLRNYWSGSWYTGHFWSLSVEEHFYLFWPVCVLVSGWRRAMWIGLFLIVVVGVWRPWELQHVASRAHALQHTDMRLDYIMMGCVVALLASFYPVLAQALRLLGSSLGLAVLFLALIVSTRPWHFDVRSLQAAIITLLVCGSATATSRIPRLLLANNLALFIGRISYSLYVWQELFLGPQSRPFLRSPAALCLKFAAIMIVASLSYYLIEKPFIAYGRSLLRSSGTVKVQELVSSPATP